jgi:Flp pilus assembly protein TadG
MRTRPPKEGRRRGAALIEFAFVCVLFLITLAAAFELCRMLLVYTTLANACRIGVRYAAVHGSTNTGSGLNAPSGPGTTANVESVVRDYTRGSLLDTGSLTITVEYPTGGASANAPGSRVRVQVVYPYDPFFVVPLNVPLASRTEGVIVY